MQVGWSRRRCVVFASLLLTLSCTRTDAPLHDAHQAEEVVVRVPAVDPPSAATSERSTNRQERGAHQLGQRLAVLSSDGEVNIRTSEGLPRGFEPLQQAQLPGASALACSTEFVFVATSETLLRVHAGREPTQASASIALAFPASPLCTNGNCFVRELRAAPGGEFACVELTDGSPSTANGTITFVAQFDSKRVKEAACPLELELPLERELADCSLTTAGGGVKLADQAPCFSAALGDSDDGRYSAVSVETSCGDYCYMDVILIDQREGVVVGRAADVETSTRVKWSKRGSEVIVDRTLFDAADPQSRRELGGAAACWLD